MLFIEIPFDPNLLKIGPFLLTWHGFFTFVGVVVAVLLATRWAPRAGLNSTQVYDTAIWAILGGIIGARLFHVVEYWGFYIQNPLQVLAVYQGGIAIWGAVLGGFAGGVIYTRIVRYPTARLADLAAAPLFIAMAIGRIGDIINGEHCALVTGLPWGFVYTDPDSPASFCFGGVPTPSMHPAVVYEMVWDLVIVGVLLWVLRGRLRPDGMLFAGALMLYAVGRFFLSFLREDLVWVVGLQESQIISLAVLVVTAPLLTYRARWVRSGQTEPAASGGPPGSRRSGQGRNRGGGG